jgi:hypothetical protein
MNDRSRDDVVDAEIVPPDRSRDDVVDAEIVPPEQPDEQGSWFKPALVGLGVVAFLVVAFFVITSFKQQDANKVADMVRSHPKVIEQMGGITECKWNTAASVTEGGKRTQVFDARGPKGSGQFVTFEFMGRFRSITLRTKQGEWELLD